VAQAEDRRQAEADERTDLFRRFLQAGIANPAMLPRVPEDAIFYLVPDDDPTIAEHAIAAATASARRGHNVYLHHVRVADLPELPERTIRLGEEPGTRRATYEPETGEMLTNQILGEDGEWHDTDEPFPIPRDDESDPLFRF
jgi:hypothetical protein